MASIVTTLCFFTLVILVIGQSDASKITKIFYDIENHVQIFKDFLKEQNKSYDGEEYIRRIKIFKKRLQEINELNNRSKSAVYGVTFFTDLTDEERSRYTGALPTDSLKAPFICTTVKYTNTTQAPETLDYRTQNLVTPVLDQMGCGSCYSFGAVGAIEGQYAKKYKQLLSFSKQQVVDCSNNLGCGGGWAVVVFTYAGDGLQLESDYPYTAKQSKCKYDKSKSKVAVSSCLMLKFNDEEDIKFALNEYGPLTISLHFTKKMHEYKGGVMTGDECKLESLNHSVLLVGYGTEDGKPYWLIKNSWGLKFGEAGYLKLHRGQVACGMGREVAAVFVQ